MILVTGGLGFIGSHTVQALLDGRGDDDGVRVREEVGQGGSWENEADMREDERWYEMVYLVEGRI